MYLGKGVAHHLGAALDGELRDVHLTGLKATIIRILSHRVLKKLQNYGVLNQLS